MQRFHEYKPISSGKTAFEVLKNAVINRHVAYGHFYPKFFYSKYCSFMIRFLTRNDRFIIAQDLSVYKELVSFLKQEGYQFKNGRKLHSEPAGRKIAHLRHDVDGDILAAIRCAEMLNFLNIRYLYILHTATYYGHFEGKVFKRNAENYKIYEYIQLLTGDWPACRWFRNFINHKIDGAQAVKQNLIGFVKRT